jgi:hypothetical protein
MAVTDSNYASLGVTDSALLSLAARGATLLTDDEALFLAAAAAGHEAIDYRELRNRRSAAR